MTARTVPEESGTRPPSRRRSGDGGGVDLQQGTVVALEVGGQALDPGYARPDGELGGVAVVPVAVDHQARRGGGDCGGDLGPAGLVDLAVRETGQQVEPSGQHGPVVADQHVERARPEAGDVGGVVVSSFQ